MENRRLRDDIKSLKSYVDDMKVELNHFKRDGSIYREDVKLSSSPSSLPKISDVGEYLRKVNSQLDEYLTEEEGEILVTNLQKITTQGEEVLRKLNHARSLVSSIKTLDQDLIHLLRSPKEEKNSTQTEESLPQNHTTDTNIQSETNSITSKINQQTNNHFETNTLEKVNTT